MSNDNFWTDELVAQFHDYYNSLNTPMRKAMDEFKASHVKKKDWEIVSFKHIKNDVQLLSISETGSAYYYWSYRSPNSNAWELQDILKESCFVINNVRRLSDNEVFTVGDTIGWGVAGNFRTTLLCFKFIDNDLVFDTSDTLKDVSFSKVEKLFKVPSKPVLFTTEDGKNVYEGDRVWFITQPNFKVSYYDFIDYGGAEDLKVYPEIHKYFSTEEAAKEYVKENKTLFSLKEIKEVIRTVNNGAKGYDTRGFLNGQFNTIAELKIANKEG